MILLLALLVGLFLGVARGGKLGRLSTLPVRHAWLPVVALAMQLYFRRTPVEWGEGFSSLPGLIHLVSYPVLLFAMWQNRHLAGVGLAGLGIALNLAAILANGGFMPITPEAALQIGRANGLTSSELGIRLSYSKDVVLPANQTNLWLLSDIFVVPPPFPLPTAFSVGDVLIALGVAILVYRALVGAYAHNPPNGSPASDCVLAR